MARSGPAPPTAPGARADQMDGRSIGAALAGRAG